MFIHPNVIDYHLRVGVDRGRCENLNHIFYYNLAGKGLQ